MEETQAYCVVWCMLCMLCCGMQGHLQYSGAVLQGSFSYVLFGAG